MYDVLTIGTATRDIFLTGKAFRVLKDPEHLKKIGFATGEAECFALGSKIEVEAPVFTIGGGAANAAVTFSRQGFKTAAFMKAGIDQEAEAIRETLKREKIAPLLARDKKQGTAYSTILLTASGERTILVYRGASSDLRAQDIPSQKLRAKWAYLAPGATPFPLIEEIVRRLGEHKTKIALNPSKHYLEGKGERLRPLLKKLAVTIVNREEASRLTGVSYENVRGIFKKFDELVPGIAVMTDGPRGAVVSDGRYLYRAGTFKERALVDRTGAGDAFGSGFVAGLIERNDITYALRLAAANATSVVEQIGAQPGILRQKEFRNKRWQYLNLDVEPL